MNWLVLYCEAKNKTYRVYTLRCDPMRQDVKGVKIAASAEVLLFNYNVNCLVTLLTVFAYDSINLFNFHLFY